MSKEISFIGCPIEDVLNSKIKTIDCFVSGHPQSGVVILVLSKLILEDGRQFYLQGHYDGAYLPIEKDKMNVENLVKLAKDNERDSDLLELLD